MPFFKKILESYDKNLPIYIVGHERPDGDSTGSQIALTLYLNSVGYHAFSIIPEDTPKAFTFFMENLPTKQISSIDFEDPAYWIALDCGNPLRILSELRDRHFSLVIDHHPKEENWGDKDYINPNASSTCEILTLLLKENDYKFDNSKINDALYLGLLMDSGNFTHNNITKLTFECAELLVQAGVQPYKITQKLFNNKTQEQLNLQGLFLSNVKLYSNGTIAVSTLSYKDYINTGTSHSDTKGFINQLLTLKDAKIAVFIECNDTYIKGSLRSSDPTIPVNTVAQKFDGGGHICAAGFKYDLDKFSIEDLIHDLDSLLT